MTVAVSRLADAIRVLAMDAVEAANSGHPGMPMGMADVATVLWTQFLKYDAADPHWPDRDRFVLSAGHGSMLIYALLHLSGYARPTRDDIRRFRQFGSPCAGHPENFELAGIEATTGPLGSGFATAVGMAIAERHLNAAYGDALVDHRTWVVAGDGCLMEGVNHEAVGLAGHLRLGRLNVLWDDNRITIDGATSLSTSEDIAARYAASGWHVTRCDGYDHADIARAMAEAVADERPSLIACRTIIGKGAPTKQGTAATHGAALGKDEVAAVRTGLGWSHAPFELPEDIVAEWHAAGTRGAGANREWRARVEASDARARFEAQIAGVVAPDVLDGHIADLLAKPASVATRKASELALDGINVAVPWTIGGSADLTGSNNTKTPALESLTRDNYAGRYVYYGIREFGMACAMNGMALHGGVIPYGGTFLVFSDYCRPAIRLAALQQTRVVFVMTHDSIGLGEDGPTHQPIEQLAALRAMPNLTVLRPCDAVETAEAWAVALTATRTPSVLALSRQNLPQLRTEASENRVARGAYRLRAVAGRAAVRLIASGSEVAIAVDVAERLASEGIAAEVISMPSWELFAAQPPAYRAELLPDSDMADGTLRVSIEAASTFGWERHTGVTGMRFGIDSFGASAAIEDLYRHFGLTADAIAPRIVAALQGK